MNKCADLCTSENCTITSHIRLDDSSLCEFESNGALKISGSVRCNEYYRYQTHKATCLISLSFAQGIELRPGASLAASTINLTSSSGSIELFEESSIDTDGLGTCYYEEAPPVFGGMGDPMQSGSDFNGAGHGGWGGTCLGGPQDQGLPYGDGTGPLGAVHSVGKRTFEVDHYGSGTSKQGGRACCGGGAVVLQAQSVHVGGKITARGQKPCIAGNTCSCAALT